MSPQALKFDPKLYHYGGLWIYPLGILLELASKAQAVQLKNNVAFYLDDPSAFALPEHPDPALYRNAHGAVADVYYRFGQHGVRALFLMDNLTEFGAALPFNVYGRGLEWGYPMGVGYRYLTLSQSLLLLRASALADEMRRPFVDALLEPVSQLSSRTA